ncbi:MAG: hypothetical protein H6765_02975 [Candidatus Peribacteria bacterium]|nr:MAG: hypothetical protein H6765_02975 [Candidatus Peribacteria bacterium]
MTHEPIQFNPGSPHCSPGSGMLLPQTGHPFDLHCVGSPGAGVPLLKSNGTHISPTGQCASTVHLSKVTEHLPTQASQFGHSALHEVGIVHVGLSVIPVGVVASSHDSHTYVQAPVVVVPPHTVGGVCTGFVPKLSQVSPTGQSLLAKQSDCVREQVPRHGPLPHSLLFGSGCVQIFQVNNIPESVPHKYPQSCGVGGGGGGVIAHTP